MDQLYTHLAQALNRSFFAIGIDNTLPESSPNCTHAWCAPPARRWPDLKVNTASIFLMRKVVGCGDFWCLVTQENDLHEKQIILLPGMIASEKRNIEQQLRELTLLPSTLSICR